MADKAKMNLFQKMVRSVKDMRGEMKRVVWPSKKQTINNTGIVIVFMIIMAVIIGAFDLGLGAIVNTFFGR